MGVGDRLQRLERRMNEVAERQEQFMRQLAGSEQRPGQPMPQMATRPMAAPQMGVADPRQMMLGPPENIQRARMAAASPNPQPGTAHKAVKDLAGLIMLTWVICNILLAVWIFTDIRKRGEGSGIFIALALVAGIPATIIYALLRLGDKKEKA